jgi:hypothetical protein
MDLHKLWTSAGGGRLHGDDDDSERAPLNLQMDEGPDEEYGSDSDGEWPDSPPGVGEARRDVGLDSEGPGSDGMEEVKIDAKAVQGGCSDPPDDDDDDDDEEEEEEEEEEEGEEEAGEDDGAGEEDKDEDAALMAGAKFSDEESADGEQDSDVEDSDGYSEGSLSPLSAASSALRRFSRRAAATTSAARALLPPAPASAAALWESRGVAAARAAAAHGAAALREWAGAGLAWAAPRVRHRNWSALPQSEQASEAAAGEAAPGAAGDMSRGRDDGARHAAHGAVGVRGRAGGAALRRRLRAIAGVAALLLGVALVLGRARAPPPPPPPLVAGREWRGWVRAGLPPPGKQAGAGAEGGTGGGAGGGAEGGAGDGTAGGADVFGRREGETVDDWWERMRCGGALPPAPGANGTGVAGRPKGSKGCAWALAQRAVAYGWAPGAACGGRPPPPLDVPSTRPPTVPRAPPPTVPANADLAFVLAGPAPRGRAGRAALAAQLAVLAEYPW